MKKLFIAALLLSFAIACKEDKKASEEHTEVTIPKNELQTKIETLQDSAASAWKVMIEADDQKIAYSKRLLDEVSYTPKYDIAAHTQLVAQTNALKDKRYTRESILESSNIDKYDAATDSLLRSIKALVLATPNVENYPLCNELLNDIYNLDGNVVKQRVNYDQWALEYNHLLESQKDALQQLGGKYATLPKMGVFQLEQ